MKLKSIHTASLIMTCVALGIVAPIARAEYRCDKPQNFIDAKACAKAKEGPRALAQFIQRTRMIYGLYLGDYLPPQ